jgi:PhnB protein
MALGGREGNTRKRIGRDTETVCRDAAAEVDFCKNTFGAVEQVRRPGPDGTVAHALMTIGPAMIMIEAEWPELTSRAPKPDGSSPVVIYVYVEDVDKTVERAVAGGARSCFRWRTSSGVTASAG